VHNPGPGYGGSSGSSGGSAGAGGSSGSGAGGGSSAGAGGGVSGAIGQGRARLANKIASLEIKDTGNAKLDAMGDVFNNALAPFHNAPSAEQGAIGVVNQAIGAVMGAQNIGMELMNTGFAMATAGIAAMMPAFPAAFLTVPHIGMPHAHAHPPSLVPPAPPVPLPSIGTLMLAGSVGVLISGMPAGRCGDIGLAVTCGSLAPAFDVFLGSSNTFIAGNRAARMTDMTRHCNPASAALAVSRGAALFSAAVGAVGVIADAVGGGPVMGAVAQIAADLAAAAMSALLGKDPGVPPAMGALMFGAPNVLIGGFPCPNLPNPLDAVMHGLKCLGKAIAKSKALGKILSKVGLCNSPGEPINTFTGEVYNDFEDYHATDSGFVWERHYRSGWNNQNGALGYGYRHFYQRSLTLLRKRAVYETFDNEIVALERLADGSFAPNSGFTLQGTGQRFVLTTDRDETLEFELVPGVSPPSAHLTRYKTAKLDLYLFYDNAGRLRALSEFSPGFTIDTLLAYGKSGCIEEVQRGVRGQQSLTITRYAYYDGCIVEWHDAMGAVARMRYDAARRMVQGTDRRGYSFHWQYDPQNGRCIKSYGDDGLWGVEAKYEGSTSTFTEADGGVWTFKHYPDGTISHIVDPLGGIKQYLRDDRDRVSVQIEPDGVKVDWLYAPDGKLIHRRDRWDNLIPPEDQSPGLPDPLMHNGPENQRDWLLGRPTRRFKRQLSEVASGLKQALAQLGTFVDSNSSLLAPAFDAMGRVSARTHLDGSVEYFQRDPEGNITARCDTKGHWWMRQIVSWNLLGAERTPSGSVRQYAHGHREIRRCWVDGNGNRGDYLFDLAQRVVEMRHQGAASTQFVRAPLGGAVLEKRGVSGKLLAKNEFGDHGLRTSTVLGSGQAFKFDYDAFGNCIDASSSEHQVQRQHFRKYFFHPIPYRVLEMRDGEGVRHGYDGSRELQHTVYLERFCVDYRVLQDGKLRVFTPDGTWHQFYSARGGEQVRENGNGTVEVSVFDPESRLCARVCSRRDEPALLPHWSTRYRYNCEGELVEQTDTDIGAVRYGYDVDGRLVSQQDSRGIREYAYDAADNLVRTPDYTTIERLPGNLLSHTNLERFEYDDASRLAKRIRWDGRITSYEYDELGQLIRVGFSDNEGFWCAAYDGLGRRIWREFCGKRTDFYWDGDRLAAEVAPNGHLRVYVYSNTDALVPFMWLDYSSVDADPESGVAFYIFANGTGMPVRVEDASAQVVWQAQHIDAYGMLSGTADPGTDLRLRFAGHFWDEHTELFYNRYRDYDPRLGRYLQPDPIDFAGGINLYAYPSNPVVNVDLLGLIHKRQVPFEPKPVPEHLQKPLEHMSPDELKQLCKHHADELARAQDTRPKKDTNNTFAVGVIERPVNGPDGKPMTHPDGNPVVERKMVATSNMNEDQSVHSDAKKHMESSGIEDRTQGEPPHLTRQDKTDDKGNPKLDADGEVERETVKTTGEGNDKKVEPYDKNKQKEHHAEQRMENSKLSNDENLVAQSPSQPCCAGCQKALGTPNEDGQRPIDKIPSDRQTKQPKAST